MRLGPLILAAVATTGTAASAWGQTVPSPPTSASREFKIGLRSTVAYETNVARANATTANSRALVPEDVYVLPQATASVSQPIGQQVLFLTGSAGYAFYRHNTRLNRQRIDLSGGAAARYFSCQETLFGSYKAAQSDLEDLDAGTSKNLQRSSGVGVGLSCGRPNGIQGSVSAQKVQSKNSAATRATSDTDSQIFAVTVAYGRPSLGTASLVYSYADSQFPNRVLPGRPIGDGFFTETIGLGYQRSISSRLQVSGNLSRTNLKREFAPPGLPLKLSSTTYAASAQYRPSSRLSVELDAARSIRPSQRTGKLYDINTAYNGVIRYDVGTRITVAVGDSYSRANSNTDTSAPLPTPTPVPLQVITKSHSNSVFGSITYRQSDRASFVLDVRQEDRKTDLPQFNYTDTRVGLTADFQF